MEAPPTPGGRGLSLTATSSSDVVLFDTDVLSYRFGGREPWVAPFRPYWKGRIGAISVVTYSEAIAGAMAAFPEALQKEYEAHLRSYLLIPLDRKLTREHAELLDRSRRRGLQIGDNDAWIAATAIRHSLPLLTNDHIFRKIPEVEVLPPEPPILPGLGPPSDPGPPRAHGPSTRRSLPGEY